MSTQTDYLERSTGGGANFYEVRRSGTSVTVAYGKVGKAGRVGTTEFPTEAKAVSAAAAKVRDQFCKGYARAVRGVGSATPQAPVLWRFTGISRTFGLFVDERSCWVGNQRGEVFELLHDGTVSGRFHLPAGVKCIAADDFWVYAGCGDGRVYDLSGKIPRVAYEIAENVDVYWLDIHDGLLCVSDKTGRVTVVDHEGELRWSGESEGRAAWTVRCDGDALYCGDSRGVSGFRTRDGARLWSTALPGDVLFGWQERAWFYAGTKNGGVYRLAKDTGALETIYPCDESVFSCAATPDGRYVFAGDNRSSIYCFDESGVRLWKLATGCGSAYSMQYFDGRLYIATTSGTLACVDIAEEALLAAREGAVPQAVDIRVDGAPAGVEPSTALETATSADEGIVLECFEDGSRPRVRVVSPGHDPAWHVQFPKGIREPGARYLVEGVRPAARGGFYRAYGEIRRLP